MVCHERPVTETLDVRRTMERPTWRWLYISNDSTPPVSRRQPYLGLHQKEDEVQDEWKGFRWDYVYSPGQGPE